ncbi:MAG: PqqD family protein [Patescibacteria group bacterium]
MKRKSINKQLIIQKLGNKTVIFDSKKSVLFTLNETASYVFQKIRSKTPQKKLMSLFAKKYAITEKQADKDIETCIADMKKKKILVLQ